MPITVNVILVVGHEKLNVEMQRTYGNRIAVLKIAKSGGVRLASPVHTVGYTQTRRYSNQVVELDAAYRERIHKYQLHTYFYGHVMQPPPGLSTKAYIQGGEQTPDQTLQLSPLSTTINFGDIVIYRIGEGETSSSWSFAN